MIGRHSAYRPGAPRGGDGAPGRGACKFRRRCRRQRHLGHSIEGEPDV
jgi:hypothetical protein